jgi:hypothetical protein
MLSIVSVLSATMVASITASQTVARAKYMMAYYTDPGSGALILQLLTTSALMVGFYFSLARTWVAKKLGLKRDAEVIHLAPPTSEESADSVSSDAA